MRPSPLPSPITYMYEGALHELSGILQTHEARRVFLVVDPGAYRASGAAPVIEKGLANCEYVIFDQFALNPKIEDVQRGMEVYHGLCPDLVIALGGGTAIDLSKLIGGLAGQSTLAREVVLGTESLTGASVPIVAIPTTSGTGSEATHFAVVYVDGEKYSLAHPSLLPRYCLVDARLTYSQPRPISIATGLDAFCQAVESLWAVGSTDESVSYAMRAMQLAWKFLPMVADQPTPEARQGMCEASNLAGRAINISKTTAPHALSYRITSQHGIPHGLAVAMTLSPLLAYNAQVTAYDCQDPRGPAHVRQQVEVILRCLGTPDVAAGCRALKEFIRAIGGYDSLLAAGIEGEEELRGLVQSVNAERMLNNPRRLDQQALLETLRESAQRLVA